MPTRTRTRTTTLTINRMIPRDSSFISEGGGGTGTGTGKRKATVEDDTDASLNPLLKRAKKMGASSSSAAAAAAAKRKLNLEEGPSSLLIVRAQQQPPEGGEGEEEEPTRTYPASRPPTKKFKSTTTTTTDEPPNSQPITTPTPTSKPKPKPKPKPKLKMTRTGTGVEEMMMTDHQVERDVRAMDDEVDRLRRMSRARMIDPELLSGDTGVVVPNGKGKGRAKTPTPTPTPASGKGRMDVVVPLPLPEEDTPRMERNKQLRAGAMAAITEEGTSSSSPMMVVTPSRRRSSVNGRGKRVSSSFEATGIITQPHNSVSESSFYKHIDVDLPESDRIRQLLIWCSLRAASMPSPTLPPLSAKAMQALKATQEEVVRSLAERKIDLSIEGRREPEGELRENEQNVRNRKWEVTYTNHIQQAQTEEEAWKKVSYGYEAYAKQLQTSLDARSVDLGDSMSAKAKGKRRATGSNSNGLPEEHELCAKSRRAFGLAKCVLGLNGRGVTREGMEREEMEREIERMMDGLEYTADQIYTWMSAAKATTDIGERLLNERFGALSDNLSSRVNPFGRTGPDGIDLIRALSKVDEDRRTDDGVRRAVREVERAEKRT